MNAITFTLLKSSVFAREKDNEPFGSLFVAIGDERASLIVPPEIAEQVAPFQGHQFSVVADLVQVSNEDGTPMVSETSGKLVHNLVPAPEAVITYIGRPSVSGVRGLPKPVTPATPPPA